MLKQWKKKGNIAICLMLFCIGMLFSRNAYAKEQGTATVSVEKFTIGQGYLIEPTRVKLVSGENAAQFLDRVLKKEGYTYTYTGTLTDSFYLAGIDGADSGNPQVPEAIKNMEPWNVDSWDPDAKPVSPPQSLIKEDNKNYPDLEQFSYSPYSGWMYSVNHKFADSAFSMYELKDGDVMRVQFTLFGYGADLGAGYDCPSLTVANKNKLTQDIAIINENKNAWMSDEEISRLYGQAKDLLVQLAAPQQEVDALEKQLSECMSAKMPDIGSGTDPAPGTDPNPGTDPTPGTDPNPGTDPTPGTDPNPGTDPAPGTDPNPGTKPDPVLSVDAVLENTKNTILASDTNPGLESQWHVIGLARSGFPVSDSWKDAFYRNASGVLKEKKGVLSKVKYSDYSKFILSMTAIGKSAKDVEGYNLLEKLADFDMVKYQGFNGPIWALIALNSNPGYEIPVVSGVKDQTTKGKLINCVVQGEIPGGGWALSGSAPDVDMTAMAIQSLASYYKKPGYEAVTASVDRAIAWLSGHQMWDGGFYTLSQSGQTANSESTSQVITALSAIGIDCAKDARFIKNGKSPVDALITYYKDGGFMHVKDGGVNNGGAAAGRVDGMATEQAFYSLVAYKRMLEGKTALYDMSDVKLSAPSQGDGTTAQEPTKPVPDDTTKPGGNTAQKEEEKNPQPETPAPVQLKGKLGLKVEKAGKDSIALKWNKITGAEGYRIFRYNPSTKRYEAVVSVAKGKTKYTFKRLKGTKGAKLTAGTAYRLQIRAYVKEKGKIVYKKTETIEAATAPLAPNLKVSRKSSTKAKLSWKKVKGSSGYEIYMSAKKKGGYKKIKALDGKKVSFTKTKLQKKKTYYFKARAYKLAGKQKIYGAFSAVRSIKMK